MKPRKKPQDHPAQPDAARLARIESKVTKLMQFMGMQTDGRKPIIDRPTKGTDDVKAQ